MGRHGNGEGSIYKRKDGCRVGQYLNRWPNDHVRGSVKQRTFENPE
jgi:hypothetical protein